MKLRGGMGELMRQANRIQRRVEQRREELKEETFEASVGNGRVTATANGGAELVSIKVDKALLAEEDLDMVQDLIVAAANAALTEARERVDEEVEKLTGGLAIPGMG